MCGIIGYIGSRPVDEVLIKGLKRLEYRGYDSAGVALFSGGKVDIRKSEGKIANVEGLLRKNVPSGTTYGIGHTRWATHGKPTTQNAHPHQAEHVVIVHNGIIENYQKIRSEILDKGHHPSSETDSELFGYLVLDEMKAGAGLVEAVRRSFLKLEGACSVVVMSEKDPDVLVGVRNGSPLVAAVDPDGGVLLASDAQPLLDYTQDVWFLENGDLVVGKGKSLEFMSVETGKKIDRKKVTLDWSPDELDKQGYPHYMLKEIHEQPRTLVDTINQTLDRAKSDPFPLAEQPGTKILKDAKEIVLTAAGTAYYAAYLGKYWLERFAGISTSVELSSEFRYREPVLSSGTVVVGVSQSGETADTLACVTEMKKKGIPTLAITNTRGSTLSREADAAFYTSAGPEIGVAATKTFAAQMMMLFMWAGCIARIKKKDTQAIFDQMIRLPHFLETALSSQGELLAEAKAAAKALYQMKGFFFIGRGYSYPMALEGALKLKEIAYIHAEGYAGGELKHGPIAMIDEEMVLVALCPKDIWRDKTISNLQEVKARGAKILGVGHPDDKELRDQCDQWVSIPGAGQVEDEALFPFVLAPVVQLLAYEIAVLRKTDVDQPRNLAKSVTVE